MSSIPAVPMDMVDAIRVIESDIDNAMVKVAEKHGTKKVSMSMIIDYFFQQCGFPTSDWNFCDALFVRYFTKVAESLYVGKAFSTHAACFLSCVCLIERDVLVQLVVDVYSDCDDGCSITLGRCRMLIDNVLDLKGGNCQQYSSEAYDKFLSYARANPTISITVNVPDLAVDENAPGSGPSCVFYSDSEHTLSTHAVYSFFAKKHRFIFWPLDMLKSQLQRVFMGEDFWSTLKKSVFFLYLRDKGVTSDTYWFAEVLQKMYSTSLSKMKALGTLSQIPFDRKPENTVTPRSKKTKLKLPPEAYALKKKIEAPMESIAQIKETTTALDDAISGDHGAVDKNGTINPKSSKSSKSGKNSGPSPLSAKHNPEILVVEEPSSPWRSITQLFTNKVKTSSSSQMTQRDQKVLPQPSLPMLSIPGSTVSSTEPSGTGFKDRSERTNAENGIACSTSFSGNGGSTDPPQRPSSPGRKLFSTLSSMMSPPKPKALPNLISRDDSGSSNKSTESSNGQLSRRGQTIVTLSPISPREKSSSSSPPSSPRDARERRRSEKYSEATGSEHRSGKYIESTLCENGGSLSPRRSIKLEKISRKSGMDSV